MISQLKNSFEKQLEIKLMAQCGDHEPLLREMIQYHFGWYCKDCQRGKRLRPLIHLLSTVALGADYSKALSSAIALEVFHNFTLVHDDIQDKGEMRQGRPAMWKKYGVEQTINTGDFLAYTAQAILARPTGFITDIQRIYLLQSFTEAGLDVMRGQHLDMLYENQPSVTVEDYLRMINFKTSRLFSLAFEMAGIINHVDNDIAAKLRAIGTNIGLAFQIQDDYLGIWGDPLKTGKSIGTDIITKKKTYPLLLGLTISNRIRELWLIDPQENPQVTMEITSLLTQLKIDLKTRKTANRYKLKALEDFECVFTKKSAERDYLYQLMNTMIN